MILFCKVKHSCQWELRRDGGSDSYREKKKSGTKTHEEKSLSIQVLARGLFIRFPSAADFQVLITPDQDFVHDALADGGPFWILRVVDHGSRCSPMLEARFRMTREMRSHVLDSVLSQGRSLRSITVDHGIEFQSPALKDWAYRRGVQRDFIHPSKPVENAFLESFSGRLDEQRQALLTAV